MAAVVTVRWGTDVLLIEHVYEGEVLQLGEGGPLSVDFGPGGRALSIGADAQGARVLLPAGASFGVVGSTSGKEPIAPSGEAVALRVEPGGRLDLMPSPRGEPTIYRDHAALGRAPINVNVTVEAEQNLARRGRSRAHPWMGVAVSLVAHGAALLWAALAMPPLAPSESTPPEEFGVSWRASVPSLRVRLCDQTGRQGTLACAAAEHDFERDDGVGPPLAVEGPSDNPDPHFARRRGLSDWSPVPFSLPVVREAFGGPGPSALWGRDDELGAAPEPAGFAGPHPQGDLQHCFGDRSTTSSDSARAATSGEARVDGLIAVSGDPTGWQLAYGAVERSERYRLCYERALEDQPELAGRIRVSVIVQGERANVALRRENGARLTDGLLCCIVRAHDDIGVGLGRADRATARYSITFRPTR